MNDVTETDWQAFTKPLKLDGESNFPPEKLEQYDYSEKEWDVDYKKPHIWSFDLSLAIFLDKGLTGIMGHAYTYPPEGIERARDIFRAYATQDDDAVMFAFETIGSDAHNDLLWALDWLKDNFTCLWT